MHTVPLFSSDAEDEDDEDEEEEDGAADRDEVQSMDPGPM